MNFGGGEAILNDRDKERDDVCSDRYVNDIMGRVKDENQKSKPDGGVKAQSDVQLDVMDHFVKVRI